MATGVVCPSLGPINFCRENHITFPTVVRNKVRLLLEEESWERVLEQQKYKRLQLTVGLKRENNYQLLRSLRY